MRGWRIAIAAVALTAAGGALAAEPIKIDGNLELSGGGAGVGNNYKNGLELAVGEINARGGVLGRPVELHFYDNQTNPTVARAQMEKAMDDEPYAVVGPTFSGAAKASMSIAQRAEVPQFVGATAADITEAGNPYIFRTYFSQKSSIPKLAAYMHDGLKVKSVAVVWANDDFGKSGRDTFLNEAARNQLTVAADLSTENGQADFAPDVVKTRSLNADAVFLYLHEEEVARFLREAKRQNLTAPIIGDATMLNPKVLELAGDTGVGARGFVGLSAEAPVKALQDMAARFKAKFGYVPDHNGFQGYIAGYAIKAMTERLGKVDPKALAAALHGATITPEQEPGILLATTWDKNGDIDREAFVAEVMPGNTQKIIMTLPKAAN